MTYQTFKASDRHVEDVTEIRLGSSVMLRDTDTGGVETYELVLESDANPAAGLLSVDAPLGRALLGRREGAVVAVAAPSRIRRFEVVELSRADHADDSPPAGEAPAVGRAQRG